MSTAAAYIRVSTDEQTAFSPASQLGQIRAYAAAHGMTVPDAFVFLDEGISGRHARNRPAFLRMIARARETPRPFSHILVWKFSRFARSRQDSIFYKSMLRRQCGIDVISVSEPLNDDPTAVLVEALLEAMDEYYSLNLGQEVRRGMTEKFSRGGVVSIPPFGYQMQDGVFAPDPQRAAQIPLLFARFAAGDTPAALARLLDAQGIRSIRGNRLDSRAIRYILRNPTYLGLQRRRDASGQMQLVHAAHPPLVSRDLFDRVQRRLDAASPRPYARIQGIPHLLRGLVRCSACGSVLTLTDRGRALQCCAYTRGQCTQSHYISRTQIEQAVWQALSRDLDDVPLTCTPTTPEPPDLTTARAALTAQLHRAAEAYRTGVDTLEEYQTAKAALHARLDALSTLPAASALPPRTGSFTALLRACPLSSQNLVLRALLDQIRFDRPNSTVTLIYRTLTSGNRDLPTGSESASPRPGPASRS